MARKASNQSAVKERLIHLLLDVGVHNSRAPLATAAKWGIEPLMVGGVQ
jgi:hypothetical protein